MENKRKRYAQCPKRALRLGLTISIFASAIVAIVAPEYAAYVVLAGAAQNTVWLWEL